MKSLKRKNHLSLASIYRFINRCRLEVKKCEEAGAHLACFILFGSALEYIQHAWIRVYPDIVYKEGKKLTDYWSLKTLNDLAYRNGFFDRQAYLASERIRKTRNMVHPNWYAGRKPLRFSKTIVNKMTTDIEIVMESIRNNL